jgi:Uma2 family endonuclease
MTTLVVETQNTTKTTAIEYPSSDGQPMAETEIHVLAILHLLGALRHYFRHAPDVYAIGNLFLYYREGNPAARKAPDIMVVKGVGKDERRSFKLWEEKAGPCVIFEITSKQTKNEDTIGKASLYAHLGVREYFLFDPLHEYLDPQLEGYRLVDGEYVEVASNEDGEIFSEELQLILRPTGSLLRLVEPETGHLLPSLDEAIALAEQEAQRAEQEAQRAEQEAQRAEQEAQRAEQEAQRAEQEAQRAEQEAQRAEQEAQRANRAEAEVERLRALLEKMTQGDES